MKSDLNNSIIYEIYPTSFYDGNGDGVGDLKGITEKLPYVKELGADIIWLNPVYKSPFKDGGYDIEDYRAIDKKFGTFDDFAEMINTAHKLGIKVLMDLVIGHTSDKHPWFKASKKENRNKYSDYYIWTDNIFIGGGNTVKGMAKRNGNYFVNYYSFQPALNHGYNIKERNFSDPWLQDGWKIDYRDEKLLPLKSEILDIIRFWLGKGVDGFRVDLAANMIKGDRNLDALKFFWSYFISEAKKTNPDCIFMSEWGEPENAFYCGFDIDYFSHCSIGYNEMFRAEKGSNILSAFESGNSYFSPQGKGMIKPFLDYVKKISESGNEGFYCVPSGYHDITRLSTFKDDDTLKCIFAFLLTFKNLPMIYYGDEIGMKHNFKLNKDGGYIRTGARTPMQWSEGENRGFSAHRGRLYLPTDKTAGISVDAQKKEPDSLFNTVKELIKLRKNIPALGYDAKINVENREYPLVFEREKLNQRIVVAINPSEKTFDVDKNIKKTLYANNAIYDGKIRLNGKSFFIGEI